MTYKTIGTHEAADKVQVLWHHLFKVVGDEDATHVHLDRVRLLAVVVERVMWRRLGDKQDRFERHLSLGDEVGSGHRVLRVLAETLVERVVFFVGDVHWPEIMHQSFNHTDRMSISAKKVFLKHF